jgi:hypothetical protein
LAGIDDVCRNAVAVAGWSWCTIPLNTVSSHWSFVAWLLQVLCNLLQLQLAVMQFDKQEVAAYTSSTAELLQQCEAQERQHAPQISSIAHLKLHFVMLQLMMLLQSGNFKELQGDAKEQKGQKQPQHESAPKAVPLVEQLDELLQQVTGEQQQAPTQLAQPYEWLPLPVMAATVHLLAAVVDKNAGKQKPGQARIAKGGFACSRGWWRRLDFWGLAGASTNMQPAHSDCCPHRTCRLSTVQVRTIGWPGTAVD